MSEQLPTNNILNLPVSATDSAVSVATGQSASEDTLPVGSEGFAAQLSSALQTAKDDSNARQSVTGQKPPAPDENAFVADSVGSRHNQAGDGVVESTDSTNPKSLASGMTTAVFELSRLNGRAATTVNAEVGTAKNAGSIEAFDAGGVNTQLTEYSALESVLSGQDMPTRFVELPTTDNGRYTNALAMQSGQLLAGAPSELTNGQTLSALPLVDSGKTALSDSGESADSLISGLQNQVRTTLPVAVTTGFSKQSPYETASAVTLTTPVLSAATALETSEKPVIGTAVSPANVDDVQREKTAGAVSVGILSAGGGSLTTMTGEAESKAALQPSETADQQVTSGVTSQVVSAVGTLGPQSSELTELSKTPMASAAGAVNPALQQSDVLDQSNAFGGAAVGQEPFETESMAVDSEAQQVEVANVPAMVGSKAVQDGFSEPANMFHATASGIVAAPVSQRSEPGIQLPVAPQLVPLSSGNADEALLDNVQWMIGENVRNATVNVTPAGMGQISIKVDMEGEQVSVSIVANQGATREALDAALPRLREQLMLQGHESVRVDIGDGRSEHSRSYEEGKRFMGNSNQKFINEEGERDAYAGSEDQQPVHAYTRGLVDAYA
ncbi:MAG: flagellar hook-length control protein FliK [Granulosicoccus sp.]